MNIYLIQNIAYKGMDLILFSNPKFLDEIRIEYSGEYLLTYSFKLLDLVLSLDLTSIGIIFTPSLVMKSISAVFPLVQ